MATYVDSLTEMQLPDRWFLHALHDDYEGFRLLLEEDAPQRSVYRISFEQHYLYRNCDESDRILTLSKLPASGRISLLEVQHSELITWFKGENGPKYASKNIRHWAILTPDDWIDVLSCGKPDVEKI